MPTVRRRPGRPGVLGRGLPRPEVVKRDDLGEALDLPSPPRRIVSLVPSLTEAVASVDVSLLVGATDYCTHPGSLDVTRVGGSKYPSVDAVLALAPDLVLANVEENRREDIEAIRAAGVAVWVTYPPNARRGLREPAADVRRDRRGGAGVAEVGRGGVGAGPVADRFAGRSSRCGAGRGLSSGRTRSPVTCCADSA